MTPQYESKTSVQAVMHACNAALTRKLSLSLESRGPHGKLAAALFRAQNTSNKAKTYRGNYRSLAYEQKNTQLDNICREAESVGFVYGWGKDTGSYYEDVLYIDLPEIGQVSFHSPMRGEGPDYPHQWDQSHLSEERIASYCQWVLDSQEVTARPTKAPRPAKPKTQFRCQTCGLEKQSSCSKPKDWFSESICSVACITIMPEGRYAGICPRDLPQDYIHWVQRNVRRGIIREICDFVFLTPCRQSESTRLQTSARSD